MPEARELAASPSRVDPRGVCTDTADAVANDYHEVAAACSATSRAPAVHAHAGGEGPAALSQGSTPPWRGLSTRRHNDVFRHPRVAYTIDEGNSLLKIWTCLQVPTSWHDNNFSPIQGAQRRRAPTLIEPQAPYQLFGMVLCQDTGASATQALAGTVG